MRDYIIQYHIMKDFENLVLVITHYQYVTDSTPVRLKSFLTRSSAVREEAPPPAALLCVDCRGGSADSKQVYRNID